MHIMLNHSKGISLLCSDGLSRLADEQTTKCNRPLPPVLPGKQGLSMGDLGYTTSGIVT